MAAVGSFDIRPLFPLSLRLSLSPRFEDCVGRTTCERVWPRVKGADTYLTSAKVPYFLAIPPFGSTRNQKILFLLYALKSKKKLYEGFNVISIYMTGPPERIRT